MSITVFIEANPTGAFTAECYPTMAMLHAADYDGILASIATHKAACEECDTYGMYSSPVMDVDMSVNMANSNAAVLFADLGIDITEDWCGGMSGDELLGRVLVALAVADDSGIPAATHQAVRADGTLGATFTDCGLAPGYKADRLGAIHDIAREAARLGRDVVWS